MTNTQKALLATGIGKPLVLINDHPIPEPGEGQVQIKVSITSLNPTDHYSRDWGLIIKDHPLPAILGKDVVGTISKIGPSTTPTNLQLGDRVLTRADIAHNWVHGGLQEFSIANISTLSKIPDEVSDEEAATLPTNLTTIFGVFGIEFGFRMPWEEKQERGDVLPKSVLIIGGGSACGQFSVEVARLLGIERIVVVGGDERELKGRGARVVIDRHLKEDEIFRRLEGEELRYGIDCVNGLEGLGLVLNAVKKGKVARLLPMGVVSEEMRRGNEVKDVLANNYFHHPVSLEMWKHLPEYLESKQITPTKYEVREPRGLNADVVNQALDEYRDGKRVTKPHIYVRA